MGTMIRRISALFRSLVSSVAQAMAGFVCRIEVTLSKIHEQSVVPRCIWHAVPEEAIIFFNFGY